MSESACSDGMPVNRQYHLDAQGNVLAITDGSESVETANLLDAWGNVLIQAGINGYKSSLLKDAITGRVKNSATSSRS
jgi:hypothetical protein